MQYCKEILYKKMSENTPKMVNEFGLWVKKKRKELRLSQRELADKTGNVCTHAYISQLETNAYFGKKGNPMQPSEEISDAVADALGESRNEARKLAGLPMLDEEMRIDETVKEFSYSIAKYKQLSVEAKELAKRHISEIIDFLGDAQSFAEATFEVEEFIESDFAEIEDELAADSPPEQLSEEELKDLKKNAPNLEQSLGRKSPASKKTGGAD